MKPVLKSYVVLSLIVLVVVACGPVTPVAPATVTPTTGPVLTPIPSPILTPTLTLMPSPTPFLPSTLVYASPVSDPAVYRLKPWTEADFKFLIESMNEGELFNSCPIFLPVVDSFYGYEYLLHVDDIDVSDPSVWTIAQVNPRGIPLPGMRSGEEYFNFLVEKLLNGAEVSISDLTTVLKSHGFSVNNTILVKDFYDKGDDALFFDAFGESGCATIGAIFAIRRVNGMYQVDTIKDWLWMFGLGSGRDYSFESVVDANKNNFPELVIEEYEEHSGTPPTGKLTVSLHEWDSQARDYRVDSFVIFDTYECREGACDGVWKVGNTDSNAVPTFIVQEYYPTQRECPDLVMQRTYRWEEHGYFLQKNSTLHPSSEKAECVIDWAEADIRFQDHGWQDDQAIQIISDALNQWPDAMDKEWGPASRDYFRLRLGIWKDLRGESNDALRLLEPLTTSPFIADYSLPSQTAAAYLSERKNSGLINACQKANEVWSSAINKEFPDPFVYLSIDEIRNFLGFANDHWGYSISDFSPVCSEDDAVFATAHNLIGNGIVNPASWFTSVGRPVYMSRQEDFNQDGRQDWLVLAGTPNDSWFSEVWFFFAEADHFDAYKADEILDSVSPSLWRVIQPDEESNPVYVIQAGKSLWIFRVSRDKQVETLVDDYGVTLLQIDQKEGTRIKVSAEDWDYKGKKIKNYVWDETAQAFITVVEEYDFESARQKVERMIFQEHKYASAISSIQQFLAQAPTEYLQTSYCELDVCQYHPQRYYPGMYYLMGIAYEMSGQPKEAARTYYFLWRDYPDSPYALLAQYKLEPVSP